ncbi:MarR family winged helix-turn-helix transcriptional regulator [Spongiimicrobium sp. 3-5]|uniref:MarR family winged helix-turn-helix transcriptional regulator n=1 Tax=Spongiimicrobium sp. 3-5 TaxID=3332596 RepID=UPI003980A184
MENDFLNGLGFIGFTARIKRISDTLMYSAIEHYKNIDIGIEPNWHLVFLLLKQERKLTVTAIAEQLQFSHPGVIKIVNKMKEAGYLTSITDTQDARKQLIQLSDKALKELPKFEKEWNNIQLIIKEFVDLDMLYKLNGLEKDLKDISFVERYQRKFT